MSDKEIEKLERLFEADPENSQIQLELTQAKARVLGPSVYLDLLKDRLSWNEYPEPIQDQAIYHVSKSLESEFKFLETRVYRCAGISHRIASFIHLKSQAVLNLLPGDNYIMGDSRDHDCGPGRMIEVSPFLIGRFPLAELSWSTGKVPVERLTGIPEVPVTLVSWNQCQDWLRETGLRLPSETEWEYACRAGSTTRYYWGYEMDDSYCWYKKNCDDLGVNGSRNPQIHFDQAKWNAFGLIDMSGNVNEWCSSMRPIAERTRFGYSDPRLKYAVCRGGSWIDLDHQCRSSYLNSRDVDFSYVDLGFRVALSLPRSKERHV